MVRTLPPTIPMRVDDPTLLPSERVAQTTQPRVGAIAVPGINASRGDSQVSYAASTHSLPVVENNQEEDLHITADLVIQPDIAEPVDLKTTSHYHGVRCIRAGRYCCRCY